MSDPPKKPGSLRDRIAAFEKGASAPSSAPAPAPRPKPAGGVSWKPKPRSPPSSPPPKDSTHGSDKLAGMSAADAKAAIGQGGSLKERMAALQGLNAFGGGPSPPPKPATEKPKWKPPPVVAAPSPEENDEVEKPNPASPEAHAEPQGEQPSDEPERVAESEEGEADPDPEEEERQRRAAIAARMARLGGTRVGMAPPVSGKKPVIKKTEVSSVEEVDKENHTEHHPAISSLESTLAVLPSPELPVSSVSEHSETAGTDYFEAKDPGLLTPPDATTAVRSPSMPVPAGPRRAAPPRKRAAKSPSPAPTTVLDEGAIHQSPSPVPGIAAEQPVTVTEQLEVRGDREPEIRESQLRETVRLPDVDLAEEGKEAGGEVVVEASETPKEAEKTIESSQVAEAEQLTHMTSEPLETTLNNSPDNLDAPAESKEASSPAPAEAPIPTSDQFIVEDEDEDEDETSRRKRIAERLAKTGGVNPLASTIPVSTSPPTSSSIPSPTHISVSPPKSTLGIDGICFCVSDVSRGGSGGGAVRGGGFVLFKLTVRGGGGGGCSSTSSPTMTYSPCVS